MSSQPARKPKGRKTDTIKFTYDGKDALVRRSRNYEVTLSAVKKAFKGLRSVSNQRITLVSFDEDACDYFPYHAEDWTECAHQFKFVTVYLDKAGHSFSLGPHIKDNSTAGAFAANTSKESRQVPNAAELISASVKASGRRQTAASTMPDQPDDYDWDEVYRGNTIEVQYVRRSGATTTDLIVVTPKTTIVDLKAFLVMRDISLADKKLAHFEFSYKGAALKAKTVRGLRLGARGGDIAVHIDDT
ncbi:hypothetical protein RhiJN_09639 [Ceratobasidium sp. AG-Ba]|nr:hypothetical protein RhiJN_09639 [Ceratobasidium sp. AG-Ba]